MGKPDSDHPHKSELVRPSVSLEPHLHRLAVKRADSQHRSFSAHVAYLLEKDLLESGVDVKRWENRKDH